MANDLRLVDANALLKKEKWDFRYQETLHYVRVIDIEDAPTVDAVEVVRCKDCKHRGSNLCPMETVELYPWFGTKNDAFCSYGERRTDNA